MWDTDLQMCVPVPVCEGDFNNDGLINTSDLLEFLGVFATECE